MKKTFSYCDHIVFCCKNLLNGISFIEELTGIQPVIGGRHLTKGTHNALLRIGENSYLEILAVDPDNKNISPPRWMGIDLIQHSTITRWAIKSSNITAEANILSEYRSDFGQMQSGSRALSDNSILSWKLSDPLTEPEVEVIPFLLDWQESTHPSSVLEQKANLIAIDLSHPNPESVEDVLRKLNVPLTIQYNAAARIKIHLETPKGIVTL